MAGKVSRRLARFNRAVTNPIQGQYAWLLPPWVVIVHRGRRSGRVYRTPVNAYRDGGRLAVVILYGERSDWVRNVLAGGAQVVRAGRTFELRNPRIIAVSAEPLPAPARLVGRVSGKVLVADLGPAQPGFGRGPKPDPRPGR
jgi:deazaflavin-dependent oxidoreductase (nitroreductase family)